MHISVRRSASFIRIRDKKELRKPFHKVKAPWLLSLNPSLCAKKKSKVIRLACPLTCEEKCTAVWRQQHRRRQSRYEQHAFSNTRQTGSRSGQSRVHICTPFSLLTASFRITAVTWPRRWLTTACDDKALKHSHQPDVHSHA